LTLTDDKADECVCKRVRIRSEGKKSQGWNTTNYHDKLLC